MKVLYLVQTFANARQIVRLVRAIRRSDPTGVVLVSHNSEAFALRASLFEEVPDVHVINVPRGSRIDFSLPGAYLDAIEHALSVGLDFDWVTNLTGQCYPARPLSELVDLLDGSEVDGYVDHHRVFDEDGRGGGIWPYQEAHSRYHYQYRWRLTRTEPHIIVRKVLGAVRVVLHAMQPWVRIDTSYALQVGVRDRSGIVGGDFPLYGGSYYSTLSRRAAEHLCEFRRSHPDVVLHFSRMNTPSEVFAHTVLANDPDFTLSNDHHFFFDVDGVKRGRSRILTVDDLDRIAASGAFFARKFDPQIDRAVVDLLDERVVGRSEAPG